MSDPRQARREAHGTTGTDLTHATHVPHTEATIMGLASNRHGAWGHKQNRALRPGALYWRHTRQEIHVLVTYAGPSERHL
jgi:hypothetical protein